MRYILVSAAVLVMVTALIAGTVGVAIGVLIMTSRMDGGAPEETVSAAVAARQDEATFAHRAAPENIS